MKTLQNNFTTLEQSKRLLELGVPVDSADCMNFGNADIFQIPFQRPFSEHLELHVQEGLKKMYTPCWSVGRLMEILDICSVGEESDPNIEEYPSTVKVMNKLHITYVEYFVKSMERAMQLGTINFLKLED